ncbi:uncharacterized protein LOC111331444 [Stylophora pistillata]|uniref:uncharacterized protein LOC111331444 n=1 Tax=Stylophora pistillata TaxID=50429 RepID=UPI000C03C9B3|nr:uncharacterized protein LOC111331444 [Stylophora pistillata]
MGLVLSSRGVGVAAGKVKAVVEAREPESVSEVKSFLSLVNYSGRFIPNLATLSRPLRRLTKKDVVFQWGSEQAAAFQKLKNELARAEVLGYYDKDAETRVITDASPVGLGAVLAQKQQGVFRVIMYASRSLTDAERRYSQTEREALAIVWACERFHTYLYGIKFHLVTDHKPLECLYSKKQQVLAIANEGHVGIVATKLRLRTKVWWPGIDEDAEQYVRSCHGCQLVGQATPQEPLMPTELPLGKWQDLSLDLLGPMPTGEYLLVVIDYYSRYYEVEILMSVTASQIISRLETIFAVHGLPAIITSDNGPQFRSEEFEHFLVDNGILHRKVTPQWAQANDEEERQNRSLLKSMRIAQAEGKNRRKELVHYLATYRTTPHTVTGVSPAELLFGRKIRAKMPELRETTVNDDELQDRDWEKKIKAKIYADERRGAQLNDLQTGNQVLLKKKKSNKLSTKFESEPYEIIEKKGNSVVVQSPEKVQYQRNVTEVKKFTPRDEQCVDSDHQFELQEDNELEQRPQRDRHPPDHYVILYVIKRRRGYRQNTTAAWFIDYTLSGAAGSDYNLYALMLHEEELSVDVKAKREGKGVDLKISKAQIRRVVKEGGSLFSSLIVLAPKVLPMATKLATKMLPGLATGALTNLGNFGMDKILGQGRQEAF